MIVKRYDNRAVGGDLSSFSFSDNWPDPATEVGYVLTHGGTRWYLATRESNGEVTRWSRWTERGVICSPRIAATFVNTEVPE